MSTTINKTDGSVLATVPDGAVNQSATNLALIGRLYRNYGELVNENFVKLLENFASNSSPSTPIVGQLWYDTNERRLKVFRDTGFVALATNNISNTQPTNPRPGDQWYDSVNQQLKFFNGTSWIVIAPTFTASQGKSGSFVETVQDTSNTSHIVVMIYQQGDVLAIFSRDTEFTPSNAIPGFSTIKRGLNMNSQPNYKIHGLATDSELLGGFASEQYLRSDVDDEGTATLSLTNTRPLELGPGGNLFFQHDGSNFKIGIPGSGSIGFYSSETNQLVRFSSSNQALYRDGSAGTPSITYEGESNTGMYKAGTNQIGFSTNGNNRLTIGNSGITVPGDTVTNALFGNIVNGDSGAFNALTVANTATIPVFTGNSVFTNNLEVDGNFSVDGNTTLGNSSGDQLTLVGSTIILPNGLNITGNDVFFQNSVGIQDDFGVDGNGLVGGNFAVIGEINAQSDMYVENELLVGYDSNTQESLLRVDSGGRILIGTSGPAVAVQDSGEVTLGFDKGIYAANTAKYWVAFKDGGTLEVYQSYNVASVTRVATGVYRINFEYNLTPDSYYAVVGTSSFGNMAIETFPTGGADFVEVRVELYDYTLTNSANYMSVAIYGP